MKYLLTSHIVTPAPSWTAEIMRSHGCSTQSGFVHIQVYNGFDERKKPWEEHASFSTGHFIARLWGITYSQLYFKPEQYCVWWKASYLYSNRKKEVICIPTLANNIISTEYINYFFSQIITSIPMHRSISPFLPFFKCNKSALVWCKTQAIIRNHFKTLFGTAV